MRNLMKVFSLCISAPVEGYYYDYLETIGLISGRGNCD